MQKCSYLLPQFLMFPILRYQLQRLAIQLMFIDSPDFSRRKVLNAYNGSSPTPQPEQYKFGLERSLLARHVAERLNSHGQDDQILERFRKQAEELKRQRWLSKKAKIPPPIPQPIIAVKSHSQELIKQNQEPFYPKLTLANSVILENENETQTAREERSGRNREAVRLEKLLNSKEKEIRRKDRKLERSRQIIEKMQSKINDLERQKRLISSKQELQNQKINALIEEMNYRIAANRAIFQEELGKLKVQQQQYRKPIVLSASKLPYEEIPPLSLSKRKKEVLRAGSDRLLAGPSVFYELPRINENTNKPNLSLLSKHSKNKFERFNPEDY